MYERSTNHNGSKEEQEIYSPGEASDTERVGVKWQWSRSSKEISDSSSYSLSLEEGPGARSRDLFEWQTPSGRSQDKRAGGREPEVKGSPCHSDPGADVIEKKDELGLTGRIKGSTYSRVQRQRIIEEVERLKAAGIKKSITLRNLGVCRSTYYGWLSTYKSSTRKPSVLSLTEGEKQAVIEKKKEQPHLSHRKISGYLRHDGYWVSESSCYRILKTLGWILPQPLREAPWREPHYEPFRPNQVWGEDWTILTIEGLRHYLLTIIDYFSRYIVAWGIVKTVTQREVKDLLIIAYISQGIEHSEQKPLLRLDKGSPNMAHGTRRLIKDLEMVISPSRVSRPTDNGRQERWYRTVKQEEIYCYPTYPSMDIARQSLARYIEEYNERRPHQALWNYTPGFVHRLGNKTILLEHHKKMVQFVKEQRLRINRESYFKVNYGASN